MISVQKSGTLLGVPRVSGKGEGAGRGSPRAENRRCGVWCLCREQGQILARQKPLSDVHQCRNPRELELL